jgi:hypothetical protein
MTKETTIPSRLPDGRSNPEYVRQYRAKRKAAGYPVNTGWTSEKHRQWRKTESGKASIKRWNESEKGKAASAKYRASSNYKVSRSKRETGEEYASRIIRDIENIEIYKNETEQYFI